MKIGIFDSGMGGLMIAHSLMSNMPDYDYIFLGDTARVPYGNRSEAAVRQFTQEAVDYLFRQDCKLIIIACNTASADAVPYLQQNYLPANYPDRRILGVLVPTAEAAVGSTDNKRVGVLATAGTVASKAYTVEIRKIANKIKTFEQAAPLLVPLVENDGLKWAPPIIAEYLSPLVEEQIDTLVLGCTHYPYLKEEIKHQIGGKINLISQNEVIVPKLRKYLDKHTDLSSTLSLSGNHQFLVTDQTDSNADLAAKLFSRSLSFKKVTI